MGCTASKAPREQQSNGEHAAQSSDAAKPSASRSTAEIWAESVAGSYWRFICRHCTSVELRKMEWSSFVSTCVDLMKKELDLSASEVKAAVDAVTLRSCPGAPLVECERAVDARISSLLEAWTTLDLLATEDVDCSTAANVLKKAKVYRELPTNRCEFSFGDIVELAWAWTNSSSIISLFTQYSAGGDSLTPEQLASFMSHGCDGASVTPEDAKEIIRKLMGGYCTKIRFVGYFGHPITNDVLDPKKSNSVWQDMSHPLTHYSISTETVRSLAEARNAISQGTRVLVLTVTGVNEHGAPMLMDGFTLPELLHIVREDAFAAIPLPFILCFEPHPGFTVAVQDITAECLVEHIGMMLAPGLMFRGSSVSDPKFTPSGLQHKVLIMAQQGPLKPFVGFGVADTSREGIGVRVTSVPAGTPASRAGIAKTDWLTHFNGEPIESVEKLKAKLATISLGEHFSVWKEGVTELCGIVGATVVADTGITSKKLSELLFLNYTTQAKQKEAPRIWDASLEPLPTIESPKGNNGIVNGHCHTAVSNGMHLHFNGSHESSGNLSSAHSLSHSHHHLGLTPDHFRFISCKAANVDEDHEMAISEADLSGVQFIDHASPAAARWARGKFSNNGHCGFVLQPLAVHSEQPPSEPGESAAEQQQEVNSVSSDGGPSNIHLEIVLLSEPKLRDSFVDSPRDTPSSPATVVCSASVLGAHGRQKLPLTSVSAVDLYDAQYQIIVVRTVASDGREFEATLPAHLIRPGYRVVSFVDPNNRSTGTVYPVLCDVRRTVLRLAASPESRSVEDLCHSERP